MASLGVADLNPQAAAAAVGNYAASTPNMGNAQDLYFLAKMYKEAGNEDAKKALLDVGLEDGKYYAYAAKILSPDFASTDTKVMERRAKLINLIGGQGPESAKLLGDAMKAKTSRQDMEDLLEPFITPLTRKGGQRGFY